MIFKEYLLVFDVNRRNAIVVVKVFFVYDVELRSIMLLLEQCSEINSFNVRLHLDLILHEARKVRLMPQVLLFTSCHLSIHTKSSQSE